eukprot:744282_1
MEHWDSEYVTKWISSDTTTTELAYVFRRGGISGADLIRSGGLGLLAGEVNDIDMRVALLRKVMNHVVRSWCSMDDDPPTCAVLRLVPRTIPELRILVSMHSKPVPYSSSWPLQNVELTLQNALSTIWERRISGRGSKFFVPGPPGCGKSAFFSLLNAVFAGDFRYIPPKLSMVLPKSSRCMLPEPKYS